MRGHRADVSASHGPGRAVAQAELPQVSQRRLGQRQEGVQFRVLGRASQRFYRNPKT